MEQCPDLKSNFLDVEILQFHPNYFIRTCTVYTSTVDISYQLV